MKTRTPDFGATKEQLATLERTLFAEKPIKHK